MEEYIQFCKENGLNKCNATSVFAYDKKRGFNAIENVIKKLSHQGGGIYADI